VLGQTNACADYTKTTLNNMCVVSREKEKYRICFSLLGERPSFFIRAWSSEIAVVIFMLSIYFPARDLSACPATSTNSKGTGEGERRQRSIT
jgi:hypothetical protein